MNVRSPAPPLVALLWVAVALLTLVGLAAAAGRLASLVGLAPAGPFPGPESFDALYVEHPWLTLAHVGPGMLFLALGPFQFVRRLRNRHLTLHRWSGRIYLASGIVVGASALALILIRSFGGVSEAAATLFFTPIFLFALVRAYVHIRRREVRRHREWMIRAYAIGLAIATIRPIEGLLLGLGGFGFGESIGSAFWLAFTSHLLSAEVWIHHTSGKRALAEGGAHVGS